MHGMFVLSLLAFIALLFLIFDRKGWVLLPVKGWEDVCGRIGLGVLVAFLFVLTLALGFSEQL